jgi:methyl-accepting chemotaxis protein
MSRGTNEKMLL